MMPKVWYKFWDLLDADNQTDVFIFRVGDCVDDIVRFGVYDHVESIRWAAKLRVYDIFEFCDLADYFLKPIEGE